MKFRYFIWTSILALILLVVVQYYFISETFSTKQEQFDNRYTSLAKLGIYSYENLSFNHTLDSIYMVMDNVAFQVLFVEEFDSLATHGDSLSVWLKETFSEILDGFIEDDAFLAAYFEQANEHADFSTYNCIRRITLLPFGEGVTVFRDTTSLPPENHPDALKIRSYSIERNNFRITYDYYLDVSERTERIVKEMQLTLILAVSSIFIVFVVFLLTLRNLLRQRRLSDMKTDFINNMTHELKTPLSTIAVASSSLGLDPDTLTKEKIAEISTMIHRQNRHLTRLIDRILDISVWEKDQVKLEKKPVKMKEWIIDTADCFKTDKPFTIHVDTGSLDQEEVMLDEIHFTTVLNNLLSNALKYGGNPPEATISVACNEQLILEVRDNGPGISREDQRHIFEKFYRSQKAKKDAIKGLGLGLYYVKQIVEAHGGSVEVCSQAGKGTTFTIQIPVTNERIIG